jgi:excisionase family DNA binding protein
MKVQRQILQELQEALREFERTLPEKALSQGLDGRLSQLLSLDEVCRALSMGKSWTYRRIKSGEIPSIRLGRSVKVRRPRRGSGEPPSILLPILYRTVIWC